MGDVEFLRQFVGNPDAYAEQQEDGSYRPVRTTLSDADIVEHLDGAHTVGSYVLWKDRARFMCWDVDTNDLAQAKVIAQAAEGLGFKPGIEFSGRKGYHVWVLLDTYEDAPRVRRVANYVAERAGFNGEVFPKQDVAVDLGNLVKMPLGTHKVTGARSRFVSMPTVSTHAEFEAAFAATPVPVVKTKTSWGPQPCLQSIQDDPPAKGERDNCMFHFLTMMRRAGLDGEQLEAAAGALNDRMPKPLSDKQLDDLLRNSEDKGPICDQLLPARQCGADCIKLKQGISVRTGEVRHAPEGKNVVVKVGPPVLGSTAVTFEHPDLEKGMGKLRAREA